MDKNFMCFWWWLDELLWAEDVDGDFWGGGLTQFSQGVEKGVGPLELFELPFRDHMNGVDVGGLVQVKNRRLDFIELAHDNYFLERVGHLEGLGGQGLDIVERHGWKQFSFGGVAENYDQVIVFAQGVEKRGGERFVDLGFFD
jgi:hypothetical protein